MKYCSKCGVELNDDAIYCPICGSKVNNPSQLNEEPVVTHTKQTYVYQQRNVCALLGFIFAFISPLAGWILSGIGLKKAHIFNGDRKNLAIWGIVIASLNFVLGIVMMIYLQPYLDELLQELEQMFVSF